MKLYESLYMFARYKETIDILVEIIIENNYHKKKYNQLGKREIIHYVVLFNYIIMDVISFLDEYNHFFQNKSEPEFKERILKVKSIAKPVYKKLNSWTDIEALRSSMIAHNWRDKKDEFIVPKIGGFNAPKNFHDLLFLQSYIHIIQSVIAGEFREHYPKVNQYIELLKPKDTNSRKIPVDYEIETRNLVQKVNINCVKYGADYLINPNAVFDFTHTN